MENVTFEQLETKVRELARENPDYTYPTGAGRCWYSEFNPEGKPACIWGRAFAALGIEIPADVSPPIRQMLPRLGIAVTSQQQYWATAVQNAQDRGWTWSLAVRHADEYFALPAAA